jgi:hypothetical protein
VQHRLVDHDGDVLALCLGATPLEVVVHGQRLLVPQVPPARAGPALDHVFHGEPRRVVGDDHLEVVEGLSRERSETELEEVRAVPGRDDDAKARHVRTQAWRYLSATM